MQTMLKIRATHTDYLFLEEIRAEKNVLGGRSAVFGEALRFTARRPPKTWREVRELQIEPRESDIVLDEPEVLSLMVDSEVYDKVLEGFKAEYLGRIASALVFRCVLKYYVEQLRKGDAAGLSAPGIRRDVDAADFIQRMCRLLKAAARDEEAVDTLGEIREKLEAWEEHRK